MGKYVKVGRHPEATILDDIDARLNALESAKPVEATLESTEGDYPDYEDYTCWDCGWADPSGYEYEGVGYGSCRRNAWGDISDECGLGCITSRKRACPALRLLRKPLAKPKETPNASG